MNRTKRLLPNGKPKYIRCYDNPKYADRFTVVFTGRYSGRNGCDILAMSTNPFHPQGIGTHENHDVIIDRPGYSHLGKPIGFDDLPERCQQAVLNDYREIWNL